VAPEEPWFQDSSLSNGVSLDLSPLAISPSIHPSFEISCWLWRTNSRCGGIKFDPRLVKVKQALNMVKQLVEIWEKIKMETHFRLT
jgi:hypothetical protein